MQRLVSESGGSEEMLAKSCAPYYRLLDEIYEKDMPVARALDRSDLLLHLDGEGLQTENPRLSLVTGIMGDVRKQVGTMIRTLVSSFNEAVELPREFDLGLSSFAQGQPLPRVLAAGAESGLCGAGGRSAFRRVAPGADAPSAR